MPYIHRDVAEKNEILAKVKIIGNELLFNNDSPITLPDIGLFARLGFGINGLISVCKFPKTTNIDFALLVKQDGSKLELGLTIGNWSCAIGPTGEIFVQDSFIEIPGKEPETNLKVYNESGTFLRFHRTMYSSVGINYVDVNNIPIMSLGLPITNIGGVDVLLPMFDKFGNVIAQTDKFTNSGAVLIKANGQKLFWNSFVNRYPFIASNSQKILCALQGFDTPEPDDFSQWVTEGTTPVPINIKQELIIIRDKIDVLINQL